MENSGEIKGKEIALTRQIKRVEDGFAVQSQTSKRFYFVDNKGECTCPDCQKNGTLKCKHAFAVQCYLQKITTTKQGVKVETKRLSFSNAFFPAAFALKPAVLRCGRPLLPEPRAPRKRKALPRGKGKLRK